MQNNIVVFESDDGEIVKTIPGISAWEPVNTWETDQETGKRHPTDKQERDERGRKLWRRQVLFTVSNYGRPQAVIGEVRKWSMTIPENHPVDIIRDAVK